MKKSYLVLLSIIFILMLNKIYISNKLYLASRSIQKNSIQINALKEESNILKLKIEKLKYKNTIIDPLFNYKVESDTIEEKLAKELESANKQESVKDQESIKEPTNTIDSNIDDTDIKDVTPKDTKELFETLDIN